MESKSKIKNLLSFWRSQNPDGDDSDVRGSMRRSRSQPNVSSEQKRRTTRSLSGSGNRKPDNGTHNSGKTVGHDSLRNGRVLGSTADSEEWAQPTIRAKRVLTPAALGNRSSVHFGDLNSYRAPEPEPIYAEPRRLFAKKSDQTRNNSSNRFVGGDGCVDIPPRVPPPNSSLEDGGNWLLERKRIIHQAAPPDSVRCTSPTRNMDMSNEGSPSMDSQLSPIIMEQSGYQRKYIPKSRNAARDQKMNILNLEQSPSKRKGPMLTSTPGKGDSIPAEHDPEGPQALREGWIRLSSNVIGAQKGNLLDSIDIERHKADCGVPSASPIMECSVKKSRSQPCLDLAGQTVLFDKIDFLSQHVIESLNDDHVRRIESSTHQNRQHGDSKDNHDQVIVEDKKHPVAHHRMPSRKNHEHRDRSFSPALSESSQESTHSTHAHHIHSHDPNASYYEHHQHTGSHQKERSGNRKRHKSGGTGYPLPRAHSQDHMSKKTTTKKLLRDRYLMNQQMELVQQVERKQDMSKHARAGSAGEDDDCQGCPCHEISMATDMSYLQNATVTDKLRFAASKGQLSLVQDLVHQGASYLPDKDGRSALHYAALNGYAEVAQYLAQQGCDIDSQDNLGYTALHRAAAQGHLDVVKVLLTEGCLADKQDEVHGNAALHEASWNGYSRTVEMLVRFKANTHTFNKAGFTALHLAAQNGHNQSARALLYAGCNPDIKNNYGDTALHTAARYGHAGVTRILISARSYTSEANKNGDTALHISAALKRRKIAKLLIESGIDASKKNKQGETATDVAKKKDYPEIIEIIAAQTKSKKSKKLSGTQKKADVSDGSDKPKEKKGFFFKKKKKDKEVDKIGGTSDSSNQLSSDQHHPPTSYQHPANVHNHPALTVSATARGKHHKVAIPTVPSMQHKGSKSRGTGTNTKSIKGMLNNYAPKNGVQYYKDLAGNVKQGPIGYAPVCSCGPALKKLEQQVQHDRVDVYDHVDATHRNLTKKIEHLDKRTTQQFLVPQVQTMDRMTRERFDQDKRTRELHLASMLRQERSETSRQLQRNNQQMQRWVDHQIAAAPHDYHVYGPQAGQQNTFSRYGMQASLRYSRGELAPSVATAGGGRLYRSKSDETLSVTSSHHTCRRHGNAPSSQQGATYKVPYQTYESRSVDIDADQQRLRSQHQQVHGPTVHGYNPSHLVHSEDSLLGPRLPPSGRSPEGQAMSTPYMEEISHSSLPETWTNASIIKHVGSHDNLATELPPIVVNNVSNDSGTHPVGTSTFDSHLEELNTLASGSYTATHVNHSKTDSGSNPDSGYGSKIYNNCQPNSAKSISTSFSSGHDVHNSSLATTASTCTTEPSLAQTTQSPESDKWDKRVHNNNELQVNADVHYHPVSDKIGVIVEETGTLGSNLTSSDVCNNNVGENYTETHKATDV